MKVSIFVVQRILILSTYGADLPVDFELLFLEDFLDADPPPSRLLTPLGTAPTPISSYNF